MILAGKLSTAKCVDEKMSLMLIHIFVCCDNMLNYLKIKWFNTSEIVSSLHGKRVPGDLFRKLESGQTLGSGKARWRTGGGRREKGMDGLGGVEQRQTRFCTNRHPLFRISFQLCL